MHRILIPVVLLAVLTGSCSFDCPSDPGDSGVAKTKSSVDFFGSDPLEGVVQVYLFFHNVGPAPKDVDKCFIFSNSVIRVPDIVSGSCADFYLFGNCNLPQGLSDKESICSYPLFLGDISIDAIPWHSVCNGPYLFSETDFSRGVKVSAARNLCRFDIGSIIHCSSDAELLSVHLHCAPVAGRCDGQVPQSEVFVHQDGYNPTDEDSLGASSVLVGLRDLNLNLNGDDPLAFDRTFYCFPSSSGRTWLTLTVLSDGKLMYYGAKLPDSMLPGTRYVIESLILNGDGSDIPPGDVSREHLKFSISLSPWIDHTSVIDFEK